MDGQFKSSSFGRMCGHLFDDFVYWFQFIQWLKLSFNNTAAVLWPGEISAWSCSTRSLSKCRCVVIFAVFHCLFLKPNTACHPTHGWHLSHTGGVHSRLTGHTRGLIDGEMKKEEKWCDVSSSSHYWMCDVSGSGTVSWLTTGKCSCSCRLHTGWMFNLHTVGPGSAGGVEE